MDEYNQSFNNSKSQEEKNMDKWLKERHALGKKFKEEEDRERSITQYKQLIIVGSVGLLIFACILFSIL